MNTCMCTLIWWRRGGYRPPPLPPSLGGIRQLRIRDPLEMELSLRVVAPSCRLWERARPMVQSPGEIDNCFSWWRLGNDFRITGPFLRESIKHRWIPSQKASFGVSRVDILHKQSSCHWFETPWRLCDITIIIATIIEIPLNHQLRRNEELDCYVPIWYHHPRCEPFVLS